MEGDAKGRSRAVWGAAPAGSTHAPGVETGSKEFFERVLEGRFGREMHFLREVIPYRSFADRRLLEIGCGAGYDAYEFARFGADYTGIDLVPENIHRTKVHLGLYGLKADVREADAEDLPFPDSSFDVVFSNGVLHHTPDIAQAFSEVSRVLQPGGEFWVLLYNRDSVFYWLTLGLFDHVLRRGYRRRSFQERLAMIENPGVSDELPLVNVFSRRQVRRLLGDFTEVHISVRKLVPEDFPYLPKVGQRPFERIPQRWLDRLGHMAGWYVIASARKP